MIHVKVRDAAFRQVGEVPNFTALEATVQYNDVGVWTMDVPADSPAAQLLLLTSNPAGGIVIDRDGSTFMAGPILSHSWKLDPGTGFPVLSVAGVDDNVLLTRRLLWPDPANPITAQATSYYESPAGKTESVMRTLADVSLGAGAILERRVPGLTQSTDGLLGKAQPLMQWRFDPLLEALQRLSTLAPDDAAIGPDGVVTPGTGTKELGFRIAQVGSGLQFQVYPLALRRHAKFSFDLGNLEAAEYRTQAPTATYAVVGTGAVADATGKSVAKDLYGYARADTYYPMRVETYVDGGSLDEAVDGRPAIDQVGYTALADAAGQVSASITPVETAQLRYGVDYSLGDHVAVALPFLAFTAALRSVTLTAGPDGERLQLGVGTENGAYSAKTTGVPAQIARLRSSLRKKTIVS